jgi:hypothetical protein
MRAASRWGPAAAVAALLVMAGPSLAAAPPKPLFAAREPIRLTLSGPFGSIAAERPGVERPHPGTLTLQSPAPETLAITLSARGISRRREENCTFPPLRIEFTGKPAEASLFSGQRRLKLVTHCRPAVSFQQHVLLEYAAYRLYGRLTPASFNVRLATIDYADRQGRPITSRLGFFIEDVDDVARRNGLRELETEQEVAISRLSAPDAARFALFQVLIGNFDWSMRAARAGEPCCHNSRLIGAPGHARELVPVPYDFDQAGFVGAPYAMRPSDVEAATVGERRYRGFCVHNAAAQAVAAEVTAGRPSLFAELDAVPQLEDRTRRRALAYVGDFLDRIDGPDEVARLLRTCVG